MRLLVTCFDPFGGESVNPASVVVSKLPDRIGEAELIKLEIPTVFYKSIEKTVQAIDAYKPDAVLSIGQAGGRTRISVERVAINCDDARIPDNAGQSPDNLPIDKDGAPAYFATFDYKGMTKAIMAANVPAELSNTAGTYVCNHIMYGVLNHIAKNKLDIKAGFIHIPFIEEQVINKPNMASMSTESLVKGIEAAIRFIADPSGANNNIEIDTRTH